MALRADAGGTANDYSYRLIARNVLYREEFYGKKAFS